MRIVLFAAAAFVLAVSLPSAAQDADGPFAFRECNRSGVPGCEVGYRTEAVAHETRELLRLAERVNREVNESVRFVHDAERYGRRDHWAQPGDAGDCEDFALAKKSRLAAAGVPQGALRLAVGVLPSGAEHAVLILVTDRASYVLDSPSGPDVRVDSRLLRLSEATHFRMLASQDPRGYWSSRSGARNLVIQVPRRR